MKYKAMAISVVMIGLMTACTPEQKKDAVHAATQNPEMGPIFTQVSSAQSGVRFINNLPLDERINIFTYEYYYNGGGVSAGDINNDGLADLYFTSNLGDNRLYLNKGNLTFEDITESSGVRGASGWTTGTTMVDINNDGYLDIYVCRSGRYSDDVRRNELYINNRDNTFTENAADFRLDDPGYSTQALFFDMDNDNDLDMFLLNHSIEGFTGKQVLEWRNRIDPYAGDKLFLNKNQKFFDVSEQSGIYRNSMGYGLGVAAGDLNDDGYVDLYITNDYLEPDYMYFNNGNGTFSEKIKSSTGHISNFGMGVDIADFNNDGRLDISVVDMVAEDNYRQKTNMKSMDPEQFYQAVAYGFHYQYMFNTLQLNRGEGLFSEIGQLAGVSNTDWSWTCMFSDLNNDGWKDIFITNGFRKEFGNKDFVNYRNEQMSSAMNAPREQKIAVVRDLLSKLKDGKLVNYVYQNIDGLTYEKRTEDWGLNIPSFSNGGITVDLDNDGDLELVVNNIDQEAFIFKNQSRELSNGNFLKVKLIGPGQNRFGIGAKVQLLAGDQLQIQENFPTRGYQSSIEPQVHFGLGGSENVSSIEVVWPDGKSQTIQNIKVNQTLTIDYKNATRRSGNKKQSGSSYFNDISEDLSIEFKHKENDYDDFSRETLLPHKMSQFGPALAIGDVNMDGLDDLFVGGARGQTGEVYVQNATGKFNVSKQSAFVQDKDSEDVDAVFIDFDQDGDQDLYVVSGGNEYNQGQSQLLDRLYINNAGIYEKSKNILPRVSNSGSCVVPGDFDGDGDQDLFIGGRVVPGLYPIPASSILLRNDGRKYTYVTKELAPDLDRVGLVTSALWTDYNGDGKPDLMLTGEWMPIKILENSGSGFSLVSSEDLDKNVGWWYSLAQADFDNDGDMDFIAGNLGLNYKYKATYDEPFKVYASDFDENGSLDIVLGYFNNGELYPLRGRQCSSEQMPFIKKKFESYHDFGLATLDQVYGKEELENSTNFEATNFASSYIENLGNGKFKFSNLPALSQISSINGIVIDDYDGDGQLDLLTAGNLYPVEVETIRNDASYGLMLKGMGSGQFQAVELTKSGFKIKGDVKSLKTLKVGSDKVIVAALNDDRPVFLKAIGDKEVLQ